MARSLGGSSIGAKLGHLLANISIFEAESLFVREALSWMEEAKFTHIIVDMDNKFLFLLAS